MTVHTITKGWYRMLDFNTILSKDSRSFLLGIGAAVLFVGGFFGYRMYHNYQEGNAAKILSGCFEAYDKARTGQGDWEAVTTLCQLGQKRYSGTSAAPFFVAFEIDALLALGKTQEARERAEYIKRILPSSSPVTSLFTAKLALMKLDSDDVMVSQEGLTALKAVAENPKETAADMARYYLGMYYASIGDLAQARSFWQSTVDLGSSDDRLMQSPWVNQAQAQLK